MILPRIKAEMAIRRKINEWRIRGVSDYFIDKAVKLAYKWADEQSRYIYPQAEFMRKLLYYHLLERGINDVSEKWIKKMTGR